MAPRPTCLFPLVCSRSAVSGRGVTELVRAVRTVLDALPAEPEPEREQQTAAPPPVALPGRRDSHAKIGEFSVESDLSGPRVWYIKVGCGTSGRGMVLYGAGCMHLRGLLRQHCRCSTPAWGPTAAGALNRALLASRSPASCPLVLLHPSHLLPPFTASHFQTCLLPCLVCCLQGAAIERFAQMTDWGYYEAARRFQRVLVAGGIDSALQAQGVMVSWGVHECV